MRTGIQAIEDAIKESASNSGRTGGRLGYFNIADGEHIIVRFLTDVDDIVVVDFYEFIQGNDGKPQSFIVAPDFYADDPAWKGEDWVRKYGGKTKDYKTQQLQEPKPKQRLVALAVEREEYPVESSSGGRPKLRTQDRWVKVGDEDAKESEKLDGRNFIVIRKEPRFWSSLVTYNEEFGTLCDRDYKISRTGSKLDTQYTITPKVGSEDPDWNHDGSSYAALQKHYGYGTGADMDGKPLTPESPDRYAYCPQTLPEWCEYQASEDRARRVLTDVKEGAADRHAANGRNEFHPDTTHNPDEAQAAPPSAGSDVSSLRSRLERHRT